MEAVGDPAAVAVAVVEVGRPEVATPAPPVHLAEAAVQPAHPPAPSQTQIGQLPLRTAFPAGSVAGSLGPTMLLAAPLILWEGLQQAPTAGIRVPSTLPTQRMLLDHQVLSSMGDDQHLQHTTHGVFQAVPLHHLLCLLPVH